MKHRQLIKVLNITQEVLTFHNYTMEHVIGLLTMAKDLYIATATDDFDIEGRIEDLIQLVDQREKLAFEILMLISDLEN